jgi:hypothetical protein
MESESYAESLEGVLKAARNAKPVEKNQPVESESRDSMLRAAALVAVMSIIDASDDRSSRGRQLGSAWSQDHRRTRMGEATLMDARQKRSTWR